MWTLKANLSAVCRQCTIVQCGSDSLLKRAISECRLTRRPGLDKKDDTIAVATMLEHYYHGCTLRIDGMK